MAELEYAVEHAHRAERITVIVIDIDPPLLDRGRAWWELAVLATSDREAVRAGRPPSRRQATLRPGV